MLNNLQLSRSSYFFWLPHLTPSAIIKWLLIAVSDSMEQILNMDLRLELE